MIRSSTLLASGLLAFAAALPASALTVYQATLTGPAENPPNASTATGLFTVTVDEVAMTLTVDTSFAGLIGGPAAAAHIHCCVAPPANVGVAVGMPAFPAVTSGSYSHVFDGTDSSIYGASFLANFGGGTAAGAFAALVGGMNAGTAYFNIHNATFPGGEIRGFMHAIPEPETYALMLLGLAVVGLAAKRRKH